MGLVPTDDVLSENTRNSSHRLGRVEKSSPHHEGHACVLNLILEGISTR